MADELGTEVHRISAVTGQGLSGLMAAVLRKLDELPKPGPVSTAEEFLAPIESTPAI